MAKRKVITRNNYKPDPGKTVKGKSMTIEGDATSIKTILQRYAMGQPLQGQEGVYIDDPDHEDVDGQQFAKMDIADQQDILTGIRAMRDRLKAMELEYDEEIKRRQALKDEPPKQAGNEVPPEK